MLKKGDVVLVPFPFTDLQTTKLRPSVVLWVDPTGQDITVCFISSQKVSQISQDELLIETTDLELQMTGLKTTSKVRVSRIVTLEKKLITRKLGELGKTSLQKLNDCLRITFQI